LQAVAHVPQRLELDARSEQVPLQLAAAVQELAHCPLAQAIPSAHRTPTAPQLLESVTTLTQAVLGPSLVNTGATTVLPGQAVVQAPFEHA
jgi:hypothetical protein